MINLVFSSGFGLIYDAKDFFELRTKHRIIGEFFGSTKFSQISLPIALSPEQTYFLLSNSIIKLIEYPAIVTEPSTEDKIQHEAFTLKLYEEQKVLLRDERKNQIESNIDKILNALHKKGVEKSRELVIQEELLKLPELGIDNIIQPIYTEHPDYLKGPSKEIPLNEINKYTSKIKCKVFEDLWRKNYYVTCGRKFGGDFLIYLGDPVLFHAICIVKCLESEEQLLNASEIVSLGRLGHSVKKKYVLASQSQTNELIEYVTIDWLE